LDIDFNYDDIFDFDKFAPDFLKIKTKLHGLKPFHLREYQQKYLAFYNYIVGPKRIIVLKPRQAGFSTLVGGVESHNMFTIEQYRGIAMADKKGRTQEIASIYKTFAENLPPELKPMIEANNSERLIFDNPGDKESRPGLGSGVLFETAHDPNAGRSGSRRFAHLSEAAFYRYAYDIDEGIQNSIPLAEGTAIIKESTANGRAGIGKPFYDLWNAAKRGESIYKHFFVSWFEIDDYVIDPGHRFIKTKYEKEIVKQNKTVTNSHLAWRRLKISEYNSDTDSLLPPEERFKQDFPMNDIEAFLSTGMPVFNQEKLDILIRRLSESLPPNIRSRLSIKGSVLQSRLDEFVVYKAPRAGANYFIGADIAEGLKEGDSSSLMVIDEDYNQMAKWHGKIDPDLFGEMLMDIGYMYNTALLIPECNNMGHTTVTTIKNTAYPKLYRETVEDKITREKRVTLGWRTTEKSKATMLNHLVKLFRDGDIQILDVSLAIEMSLITREGNGKVELNGRDRVVAACLACIGRMHSRDIDIRKTNKAKKLNSVKKLGHKDVHDPGAKKKNSNDFY